MNSRTVELTPVVVDPRWLSSHAKHKHEVHALIDGHLSEGDRATLLKHIENCRKANQILAFTLSSFPGSERPSLAYVADHHKLSRHAMDAMRDTVLSMCDGASLKVTPRLFLPERLSRQAHRHFSRWAAKCADDGAPEGTAFSCLYLADQVQMNGSELCERLGQWIMVMVTPWMPTDDADEARRHLSTLRMSQELQLPSLQVRYDCEGWAPKDAEDTLAVPFAIRAHVVLPKMRRHMNLIIEGAGSILSGFNSEQPGEDHDRFAQITIDHIRLAFTQLGRVNASAVEREVEGAFRAAMEDAGSGVPGKYQGVQSMEVGVVDGGLCGGAMFVCITKAQALALSDKIGRANREAVGRAERDEAALKEANAKHVDTVRALRAQQVRRESVLHARIERLERSIRDAAKPAADDTSPTPQGADERISRLEADVRQLVHRLDRVRDRRDQLAALAQALRTERDEYRSELWQYHQQARTDSGETAPVTHDPLAASRALERLDRLGEWAASQLGPEIVLTRRALHAAEKSVHDDPALIARCLLAMKAWYAPMIFRSDDDARKAWRAFLTREHLEDGSTGKAVEDRRTSSSYTLTYGGCELRMDRHIQGSSSRDATRTLRIYFAIDKAHDRVVVGYLPGHLPNTLN